MQRLAKLNASSIFHNITDKSGVPLLMETAKVRTEEQVLQDKIENLIAIGAATAANCIPCFEHLYEKAITSGITLAEIKRASDIAGQVKKGAHIAITNSVNELIGIEETHDLPCDETANKSCCG
jgi:alkylhydroperoxidase/carboxymuconolactone decarboxylase family protein YurZ